MIMMKGKYKDENIKLIILKIKTIQTFNLQLLLLIGTVGLVVVAQREEVSHDGDVDGGDGGDGDGNGEEVHDGDAW